MKCTQGSIWSIVHSEKRNTILYTKVEDAYDIWMHETRQSACFGAKFLNAFVGQLSIKYFDSNLRVEMNMLA